MIEVDIRGEPCGMPVLRVEKVLEVGAPFVVLGDDPQTLEELKLLAVRRGWICEASGGKRDWTARFRP